MEKGPFLQGESMDVWGYGRVSVAFRPNIETDPDPSRSILETLTGCLLDRSYHVHTSIPNHAHTQPWTSSATPSRSPGRRSSSTAARGTFPTTCLMTIGTAWRGRGTPDRRRWGPAIRLSTWPPRLSPCWKATELSTRGADRC